MASDNSLDAEATMGIGTSACKGLLGGNGDKDPSKTRNLTTVTQLPFLPTFEDRPPFQPPEPLGEKDSSLLKALTHHRTPFAVVDCLSPGLTVLHATGGFVAGMRMSVEDIEGAEFATLLKNGLKASRSDVNRLTSAVKNHEVRCFALGIATDGSVRQLDRF